MIDLTTRLGLGDSWSAPTAGEAAVWSRGAVRTLPKGLVLGVPRRARRPGRRRASCSRAGVARAALDRFLPATKVGDDIGVGDLVRTPVRPRGAGATRRPAARRHSRRAQRAAERRGGRAATARARRRKRRSLMEALPDAAAVDATPCSSPCRRASATSSTRGGEPRRQRSACTRRSRRWRAPARRLGGQRRGVRRRRARHTRADHGAPARRHRARGRRARLSTMTYASVVLTLLAYPSSDARRAVPSERVTSCRGPRRN